MLMQRAQRAIDSAIDNENPGRPAGSPMPATEVTKDQFRWEGDFLVHAPTGARFNASTGVVDWGDVKAQPDADDFEPVHVAYVAGQLLAGRSSVDAPFNEDSQDGE